MGGFGSIARVPTIFLVMPKVAKMAPEGVRFALSPGLRGRGG